MAALKYALVFIAFIATTSVTASPATSTSTTASITIGGPGPVCHPEGSQCGPGQGGACCKGLVCVSTPPLLFSTCKPVA
ncbi:hypothetical protein PLICRDRAFT_169362 [Plicaturopsis crispa FD-325 SS-3]|nr:hypothetical protein PLICRDRAFT_169362 [Plicaturopsis crispa FD-325 SS-3]